MNYDLVRAKLTELAKQGFVFGAGEPESGKLDAQTAIEMAMGIDSDDEVYGVAFEDKIFRNSMNNSRWSSRIARAEAMLPLCIAQLGTAQHPRNTWVDLVSEGMIRRVLPKVLRYAALASAKHSDALHHAALRCEGDGDHEAALHAKVIAYAADLDSDDIDKPDVTHAAFMASLAAASGAKLAAREDKIDRTASCAARVAYNGSYAAYFIGGKQARDALLHEAVAVALDAYRADRGLH